MDVETLERLARARDFIDHCYDHPLSLDQISEKVGVRVYLKTELIAVKLVAPARGQHKRIF